MTRRKLFILFKISRSGLQSETGAHMLELALTLPLFFICFFGVFDVARMTLGYSAVRTGAYSGARRGIGIYRPVNPSADFEAAFLNENKEASSTTPPSKLNFFPFKNNVDSAATYYNSHGAQQLFRVEAMSLAYAYRIIEQSTGAKKWPCDDEPDCLACVSMSPNDPTFDNLFCRGLGANKVCEDYMGIRCLCNVPITAANVGFGILPEFVQVSAEVYIPMANFAEVVFVNGGVAFDADASGR